MFGITGSGTHKAFGSATEAQCEKSPFQSQATAGGGQRGEIHRLSVSCHNAALQLWALKEPGSSTRSSWGAWVLLCSPIPVLLSNSSDGEVWQSHQHCNFASKKLIAQFHQQQMPS